MDTATYNDMAIVYIAYVGGQSSALKVLSQPILNRPLDLHLNAFLKKPGASTQLRSSSCSSLNIELINTKFRTVVNFLGTKK